MTNYVNSNSKEHLNVNASILDGLNFILTDEIKSSQAIQHDFRPKKYANLNEIFPVDYFPITQRQMKQSWRYLRKPVRTGTKTELDIATTIKQISHRGIFLDPVMIPRQTNRAEVLLLIDQDGSMAPFQSLAEMLIGTALQAGRLGKLKPFYFHNCPNEYLYEDKYLLESRTINEVFRRISKETVILFFSDAGAARGTFNPKRIRMTRNVLREFRQYILHMSWLNPLPRERWKNTTASAIAEYLPMFEFNHKGFQDAIKGLKN